MRKTLACLVAAATFAGGVASAGQAFARPPPHGYHGYDGRHYDSRRYRHRDDDDDDGAAIAAGIVGLALGAALASGSNSGRSYDRGYYAPPPRYYAPSRSYSYTRTCRTTRYWDPYYGHVERTRCW